MALTISLSSENEQITVRDFTGDGSEIKLKAVELMSAIYLYINTKKEMEEENGL